MSSPFSKSPVPLLSVAAIALLSSCKVTDISDEEQSASLAPYSEHKIKNATLEQYFGGRTAFLIGAESLEIKDHNQISSTEDENTVEASFTFRLNTDEHLEVGTAIAIDPRGYFITAGHCIDGPEIYAAYIGEKGESLLEKVEPVWIKNSYYPAVDFALFKVEGKPAQTFNWAESFDIGDTAFSSGATVKMNKDEDPPLQLTTDSFAGEVKKTRDVSFQKTKFQLIWHRSPVRRGNSGGPLVNGKGELIGVNYAATSPIQRAAGAEMTPMGYAIRPDRKWILDLIEKDWAKRQNN